MTACFLWKSCGESRPNSRISHRRAVFLIRLSRFPVGPRNRVTVADRSGRRILRACGCIARLLNACVPLDCTFRSVRQHERVAIGVCQIQLVVMLFDVLTPVVLTVRHIPVVIFFGIRISASRKNLCLLPQTKQYGQFDLSPRCRNHQVLVKAISWRFKSAFGLPKVLLAPQKALKMLCFQGFLLFSCRCHTTFWDALPMALRLPIFSLRQRLSR